MVGAAESAANPLDFAGAHGILFDHMVGVGLIVAGIELHDRGLTKTTFVDLDGNMFGADPRKRNQLRISGGLICQ